MTERRTPRKLTERQWGILQLAAEGHSNASIGRTLFLAEDTVKTHLRRAYQTLGVSDRAHAVALGIRAGKIVDRRRSANGAVPAGGDRRGQVLVTLEDAYDKGAADERARMRAWLLAGVNGPGSVGMVESTRTELLAVVDATYSGERWAQAPPARPRF